MTLDILKNGLFFIIVLSGILEILGLIITLGYPKARIWPPPGKKSWQFWYVWGPAPILFLGIPILGILDLNTFRHELGLIGIILGGGLLIFGFFFGFFGVRTLSYHQSLGLKGKMVTYGPYKYTRNPQYVSNIALVIATFLLTNSMLVLVTGILAISWFLIAPLCEEPWLQLQFGNDFRDYLRAVPRFIGIRSFRRILKKTTLF